MLSECSHDGTFSDDLRLRMVKAVEAGATVRAVAKRYEVSPFTVVKLMQRVRRTGSVSPAQIGGQRTPLLAPYAELLVEMTRNNKGITLAELRDALVAQGAPRVDLSTLWHMLCRLGLTHKKSR